jgi:hypothetical protein
MISEGTNRARSLGFKSILVLGHSAYYRKFGFDQLGASFWSIVGHFPGQGGLSICLWGGRRKMSEDKKDNDIKKFMGMPMRWDHKNIFKGLWDPNDDRLLVPKYFGIGWNLNFHALLRQLHLIKPSTKQNDSAKSHGEE